MVNNELVEWFKIQKSRGHSSQQLKDCLAKQGYSESDINEVISYADYKPASDQQLDSANFIEQLKLFFLNPKELLKNLKTRSSIGKGILNYIILTEIFFILGGIIAFNLIPDIPEFPLFKTLGIFLFVVGIFLFPIMVLVLSFIFSGILYLLAKIFKGSGEFKELYYLLSIIIFPLFIVLSVISSLINWVIIKISGNLANNSIMIIFMIFVYAIIYYFVTLILKEVGQFKTYKAVLCWAIPIIIIAIFYISLFLSVSKLTGLQPFGTNIEGFEVLSPQKNSMIMSDEIDKSYFTLGFINVGDELIFNTSTLTITKNNNQCIVNNLNMFGSVHQDFKANPILTIPKQYSFFLEGEMTGTGCGGVKGEEYSYFISMKIEKGSQLLNNLGTISGKYIDNNMRY